MTSSSSGADEKLCYAASIGGCGGGLSREHPFPKCMLAMIDDGYGVTVSGLSWLKGQLGRHVPDAFASNVLCRDHNSELGVLDEEGKRLLAGIGSCISNGRANTTPGTTVAIDARKIERLMMQVLCGSTAAGFLQRLDGRPSSRAVPREWVEALFGRGAWPAGWQLAVAQEGEAKILTLGHDSEFGLLHLDDEVAAVEVRLAGVLFVLVMKPGRMPEAPTRLIRMPDRISVQGTSGVKHSITFSWPSPSTTSGLDLTFVLKGREFELPPPLPPPPGKKRAKPRKRKA